MCSISGVSSPVERMRTLPGTDDSMRAILKLPFFSNFEHGYKQVCHLNQMSRAGLYGSDDNAESEESKDNVEGVTMVLSSDDFDDSDGRNRWDRCNEFDGWSGFDRWNGFDGRERWEGWRWFNAIASWRVRLRAMGGSAGAD